MELLMFKNNIFSGRTYYETKTTKVSDDGNTFIKNGNTWIGTDGEVIQKMGDDLINTKTGVMSSWCDPFEKKNDF
jgi:hypothetical protein